MQAARGREPNSCGFHTGVGLQVAKHYMGDQENRDESSMLDYASTECTQKKQIKGCYSRYR